MSTNGIHRHRDLLAVLIAGCGAVATGAIVYLSAVGRDVPPVLAALAGASLGSLCTAFTRFPPPNAEEKKDHASP